MTNTTNEVWITGIGMVSCMGEGAATHWQALSGDKAPKAVIDTETFKPYAVHPLPEMDWALQMPRKDQRQMENWQRLGVYAAGLALDDAGIKDKEELVSTMDLVVCAGGGERDLETDENILKEAKTRNDRDLILNERLPQDLRPTLFLAQLSNLMAGNISIVHKVTGSSRTYMGEESAGITAIRDAVSRIAHGQSTHLLVGGGYNAERPDLFLNMELAHFLAQNTSAPVEARQKDGGGLIPGSAGVFLVLESAEHAKARGAKAYAKLSSIASDLGPREADETKKRLHAMIDELKVEPASSLAVITGSTGCKGVTEWEFDTIRARLGMEVPIRAYTSMIGNPIEANFPFAIALASLALHNNSFYPSFEETEKPVKMSPNTVMVSTVGHYRGEGFALVEKIT
ncbi:MAG: beta-ketoacyl-ACP synthase [Salaquimonas sp.]